MKVKVTTLDNKAGGEVELKKEIYGLPVRADILQRMVEWQRSRKQAGTHKTKTISEIAGSGKKPFKQKGTGNARQGSRYSTQQRGGQTVFGPVPRSHATTLTKKFRVLGLKTALSAKAAEGNIFVIKDAKLKEGKTKLLKETLGKLNISESALFIDGVEVDANFKSAAQNLPKTDILPTQGANVYDILNHEALVITEAGLKALEERLND